MKTKKTERYLSAPFHFATRGISTQRLVLMEYPGNGNFLFIAKHPNQVKITCNTHKETTQHTKSTKFKKREVSYKGIEL